MRLALVILVAVALLAIVAHRPTVASPTATPAGWKWGDDGQS